MSGVHQRYGQTDRRHTPMQMRVTNGTTCFTWL